MKGRVVSLTVLLFWLMSGVESLAVTGTAPALAAADSGLVRDIEVNGGASDDASFTTDFSGVGSNPHGLVSREPLQVQTDSAPLSPDHDYDGLTDDVETNGLWNAAGFFTTDPLDPDSDDDGLTDGEEKLYDTHPLDDHSPGIYVEYEDHLKTRQYSAKDPHSIQPWGWQQYGDRLISLDAVVVRRGATFSVGGPTDATIQVVKSLSSLTTLTPVQDACTGRWPQTAQWASMRSPYKRALGARA